MATLTDRPDIIMDVFSNKAHCWKTSCQCWCTCKSESNVVSTTTYYDFVSAALCSTDDLPRKSEAHCYTKRHAKKCYRYNVQIIVVTAKIQISLRVLSVESQASFLYYVQSGSSHSAPLSFVC